MRTRGPIAVLLALTVTTLTGCAQSVDPIERLGKKAAQRVHPLAPPTEQPYRRWGLTAPLLPAPPHTPSPLPDDLDPPDGSSARPTEGASGGSASRVRDGASGGSAGGDGDGASGGSGGDGAFGGSGSGGDGASGGSGGRDGDGTSGGSGGDGAFGGSGSAGDGASGGSAGRDGDGASGGSGGDGAFGGSGSDGDGAYGGSVGRDGDRGSGGRDGDGGSGGRGAFGESAGPGSPDGGPPRHPVHPGHPRRESLPPVVDRVPTRDKVVFLTYDDGAERDPRFIDMVRELRLPVSVFLTDSVVGPGYGHFARLRSVGATLENHTLDHAALRGLPYAGQRAEICGQQEKLHARFGLRPRLFRPPYGTYDTTTLRAAADCGVTALVLWRAAVGPGGLTYTHGTPGLRPGDIVAVDPDESAGPSLRERTTRLLRAVQRRGLTVGKLEDYL